MAPDMSVADVEGLRFKREGYMVIWSERGPREVECDPSWCDRELLSPLKNQVGGHFRLIDLQDKKWHSFVTEAGRRAFLEAVLQACNAPLQGATHPFEWYEEWRLEKVGDSGADEDDAWVQVFGPSEAVGVDVAMEDCVNAALASAGEKFKRRWADLHILVLQAAEPNRAQAAAEVLASLDDEDTRNVDLILLVDGTQVLRSRLLSQDSTITK